MIFLVLYWYFWRLGLSKWLLLLVVTFCGSDVFQQITNVLLLQVCMTPSGHMRQMWIWWIEFWGKSLWSFIARQYLKMWVYFDLAAVNLFNMAQKRNFLSLEESVLLTLAKSNDGSKPKSMVSFNQHLSFCIFYLRYF